MNTPPKQRKWYKTYWGILIIIIITFFLASGIAFGMMVLDYMNKIKTGEISTAFKFKNSASQKKILQLRQLIETDDDPFIGAKNPKITIVNFVDLSCPKCKQSYPIMQELIALYKDDIKIIIKDFPLIQESSFILSLASECANEQQKFWPFYDKIMNSQSPITENMLNNFALQSGLNIDQFTKCAKSKKYKTEIKLDAGEGITAGVTGTPAWFINGHKVEGVISLETFKEIINLTLKHYN